MGCTMSSISYAPVHAIDSSIKPLQILLVDKSPYALYSIKRQLTAVGHNVTTSMSGIEAVEIIKEKWLQTQSIYQVIMIDLNMPFEYYYPTNIIRDELEDNLEANIPEKIRLPQLFIIGMTNNLKHNYDGFEYDELLLKPFTMNQFHKIIKDSKHLIHYKTNFTP